MNTEVIEKIINGIIDFIWSTLGIEALIPPPHIKLCSNSSNPGINDAIKIANDLKKDTNNIEQLVSDNNLPPDASFVYDITLDDGSLIKGPNYDELQKYINDNESLAFDFRF